MRTLPDPLREPAPSARDRLLDGRVLIVGAGGLGVPAALHLATAGVGTVGLIDGDAVELSNLHRQILYRAEDVGRPKVGVAAKRVAAVAPRCRVRRLDGRLTGENVREVFVQFDFVIDATDGIASKYLVNDGAVLCGIAYAHAGVVGLQGQLMTVVPRRSACLRCLFPTPPADGDLPTCQEAGILGPLAGSIGLLQAGEALKYLLGTGTLLTDRLLICEARSGRWRSVALSRNRRCPLCGERPSIREPGAVEPPASR
jgi:molybdopterin/thiamine biosynthesis adenylyltransferase